MQLYSKALYLSECGWSNLVDNHPIDTQSCVHAVHSVGQLICCPLSEAPLDDIICIRVIGTVYRILGTWGQYASVLKLIALVVTWVELHFNAEVSLHGCLSNLHCDITLGVW